MSKPWQVYVGIAATVSGLSVPLITSGQELDRRLGGQIHRAVEF